MSALLICVLLAALVFQVVIAARLGRGVLLVVGAQAAFWMLSFVLRPIYLLATRPSSPLWLGDRRLAFSNYESGLVEVLAVAVVGQVTFTLTLLAVALVWRQKAGSDTTKRKEDSGAIIGSAVAIFIIGWAFRLLLLQVDGIGFVVQMSTWATTGACVLIMLAPGRNGAQTPITWTVVVLLISEAGWSLLYASKTPIIAASLALGMRWLITMGLRSFTVRLLPLTALVVAAFLLLQPIKGITTAERVEAASGASGALAVVEGPFVALLERFDGFTAVTDAVTLNGEEWISTHEYVSRLVVNGLPNPGLSRSSTVGQDWAREVRTATNPDQTQDVSLAAGATAEGMALSGPAGAVAANAFLAVFSVIVGRGLVSRRAFYLFFAATFAFSTVLMEQATLGLSQTLSRAIQIAVVAALISLLLRAMPALSNRTRKTAEFSLESGG